MPEVLYRAKLKPFRQTVIGGMGGSHLSAGLLNAVKPALNLRIRHDYGLPPLSEALARETFFIAISYSGNTEETIDFAREARARGHALAVIATGGILLQFARSEELPHVALPDAGVPPRAAAGAIALALAELLGERELSEELRALARTLSPARAAEEGRALARTLSGTVPLVYASARNAPLAYFWKIAFNESAKIPAFWNEFPEADHNEIESFAGPGGPRVPLHALFLRGDDHPRTLLRSRLTEDLYRKRLVPTSALTLSGSSASERVFGGALRGLAAALALGEGYGNEPLRTPLIDQLKERMGASNAR